MESESWRPSCFAENQFLRLDALANNTSIVDSANKSMIQKLKTVFCTKATGPYVMVNVFAILLANSIPTRCVVNVTSGAGSISLRLDPNNSFYKTKHDQYRVSKTALNMVTACQITEYHPRGRKVSMYCLGWTESNLSPANKVANGAKVQDL